LCQYGALRPEASREWFGTSWARRRRKVLGRKVGKWRGGKERIRYVTKYSDK
jgi:hypothetical protein